jgi:uncharacterized membrane protein
MMLLRPFSLGLATLTTGLIAGFFYAYTCSVTLGTARLDDAQYIAAMQAINATVRNPLFAFSFFGALFSLGLAAAIYLRHERSPRTWLILLSFLTYALGGFALTLGVNVPLNEDLARVRLDAAAGVLAEARRGYEGAWNTWNAVRTGCSVVAFLLLIAAPFTRSTAR